MVVAHLNTHETSASYSLGQATSIAHSETLVVTLRAAELICGAVTCFDFQTNQVQCFA